MAALRLAACPHVVWFDLGYGIVDAEVESMKNTIATEVSLNTRAEY
jgi:hypothetical protein